jgi:GNAT superfamily N-acetyltransferase
MSAGESGFHYRLLERADVDRVPISCQGERGQILERIASIGSSAMMAFEADTHVGQLQFRPYVPGTRSPAGIGDPLYWMDFGDHAPPLPQRTLAIFCYHVGQLETGGTRDPKYFGRGMGTGLLDRTIAWARESGIQALVGKGIPPVPPLAEFMGGMPAAVYASRGFELAATYREPELRTGLDAVLEGRYGDQHRDAIGKLVREGADLDELSAVTICVLRIE